jgi:hypothetical protein
MHTIPTSTLRHRLRRHLCAATVVAALGGWAIHGSAQTPTGPITRTADGKPNLTGIWQAMNTANWDLQAHEARMGPVISLAAAFSVPPGPGVVVGNEIPYLPQALAKKKENGENWMARDPEVKCYMPGIPRATYQGFPFQIVQSTTSVVMSYEFASASRIVRFNPKDESPAPAWMGWNVGRWDGDTLVIDVTDQMEETWFDRAGNYHSDALKVTERITPIDGNTLKYEATIEDPKVFSRPWTISMPLYRRREANAQLMEYKCVPFAEELMYGHLRKKPSGQ